MIGNSPPDAYEGPSESPHAIRAKLGWIVQDLLRNRDTYEMNRVRIERSVDST